MFVYLLSLRGSSSLNMFQIAVRGILQIEMVAFLYPRWDLIRALETLNKKRFQIRTRTGNACGFDFTVILVVTWTTASPGNNILDDGNTDISERISERRGL